jgi:hypothetical protein
MDGSDFFGRFISPPLKSAVIRPEIFGQARKFLVVGPEIFYY